MLTIENVEALHLHLPQEEPLLSKALARFVISTPRTPAAAPPAPQTSAPTASATPALGSPWSGQGGRFAGTMPARDGKPAYHLILAGDANKGVKWGPYDHDVDGAKDHHDGATNTRALIEDGKEHPAAKWANQVREGYADWYLPSHNELMLMWICVPQLFEHGYHWSSTQYSSDYAWAQDFEDGRSSIGNKGYELRAVAVRRLVL